MVSNPRCLISQIAVTFDEGDRAGVSAEKNGPSQRRESVFARACVCVCVLLMCTEQIQLCPPLPNKSPPVFFSSSSFFKHASCVVYSGPLPPDTVLPRPTLPLLI